MNYKKHTIALLGTFFLLPQAMSAFNLEQSNFDAIFDDPELAQFLDDTEFTPITRANTEDVVDTLVDIGAVGILQQDIYLQTNPLNKRNIPDLPLFRPDLFHLPKDWMARADLFWNQVNGANFTRNSNQISSYLNLGSQSLIEALKTAIDTVKGFFPNFNIDLLKVLPLLEPITVQEHRIGFLLQAIRAWEEWGFRIMLPLYYQERNFFLSPAEADALELELGALSPEEQDRFAKEHLISDKLGFGDIRLQADKLVIDRNDYFLRVGGQLTLPIAFPLARGIQGSRFRKSVCRPDFDFKELFCLGEGAVEAENQRKITDLVQEFLLGALDQLSANLLETGLGNGGHLRVGAFGYSEHPLYHFIKRPWAERVFIRNKISVAYLFPHRTLRCFIELPNPEEFAARDFEDPAQAEENLVFLNEQFINKLYPFAFSTRVHPGFVFWWTATAHAEKDRWSGFFGWDFWAKGRDSLADIRACLETLQKLDICKARLPFALQFKILGSAAYRVDHDDCTWILSLNVDKTFIRAGMGKDFTVTLGVEAHF